MKICQFESCKKPARYKWCAEHADVVRLIKVKAWQKENIERKRQVNREYTQRKKSKKRKPRSDSAKELAKVNEEMIVAKPRRSYEIYEIQGMTQAQIIRRFHLLNMNIKTLKHERIEVIHDIDQHP